VVVLFQELDQACVQSHTKDDGDCGKANEEALALNENEIKSFDIS
jgi:hypothetical protein